VREWGEGGLTIGSFLSMCPDQGTRKFDGPSPLIWRGGIADRDFAYYIGNNSGEYMKMRYWVLWSHYTRYHDSTSNNVTQKIVQMLLLLHIANVAGILLKYS
jgi:hypothetical protein